MSTRHSVDQCAENGHYISEWICEVGGFSNVSKQAIMIRLLDPALVANCTGKSLGSRCSTCSFFGEDYIAVYEPLRTVV